jgi:hypothetical protein
MNGNEDRPTPWFWMSLAVVTALALYAIDLVSQRTITIVTARRLLPRWDLAAHLIDGWTDYHLLVTGRVHHLAGDLWMQGYWPPGLSLFQMPFHLLLGGGLASGLWSSAVAFVLVAALGSAVLLKQWRTSGFAAASVFVALLVSSPFILAYASVTMTEMLGALAQVAVVAAYTAWSRRPDRLRARLFAMSLTTLFFVKYNYFVMLAVPLVVHEWLERTSGWSAARRLTSAWTTLRRLASSRTVIFAALYLTALGLILATGGFETRVLGQRISVRSIGSSGHVFLYVLLLRVWYLYAKGRVDSRRLSVLDTRIQPLLVWFVAPVTVWLATPYPNHIRDVASLVINRPFTDAAAGGGVASYFDALRLLYFPNAWVMAGALAVFAIALARYSQQPPLGRLLAVTVPIQGAALALHHTQFSRFLVPSVVLLCLAVATEIGRWIGYTRHSSAVSLLLAPAILVAGMVSARRVVEGQQFQIGAFENYTDDPSLRAALDDIRGSLGAGDRLLIAGEHNDISPSLLRWELGPPMGVGCFPVPIAGAARVDPDLVTRVLMLAPLDSSASLLLDTSSYSPARVQQLRDGIDRGDLVLAKEFPVRSSGVLLRLYRRASPPKELAECRP